MTLSFSIDSIELIDCDLAILLLFDLALLNAARSSFLSVPFCFSSARMRFEAVSASTDVLDNSDFNFSIVEDDDDSEMDNLHFISHLTAT